MLQKTTLFDAVIGEIRARISVGTWKPGQKLPPVQALVKEFGVSRTPLREALKALAAAGVLDIRAGDGVYVAPRVAPSLATSMASLALWDGTSVEDVLEVRELIEIEAAGRAARHASAVDVRQLEDLLRNMEQAQEDVDAFVRADLQYHLTMAAVRSARLAACAPRPRTGDSDALWRWSLC